ncbi:phosphatidylinositol glycan [Anaeramoeba flamelloides]|uniref:GPI ethanolamine phosphate transferase 1 n=1 Tax=Anaeramoeba flamelloides TaxID=1746091 RepID=A0ABQ8X7T1_9EUKA|nr:phosphatidylinositol glycan [Anaeramoeba flamelloides]
MKFYLFLFFTFLIFVNLITLYVSLLIEFDSPYVEIDEVTKPQYYYSNRTKEQENVPPIALSKRFFLFILDGMPADSFFTMQGTDGARVGSVIEYMHSKMNKGQFGVSLTTVPTETHACHMNLFSGRPEDPSLLFHKFLNSETYEYDSIWSHLDYSLLVGAEVALESYTKLVGTKVKTEDYVKRSKHVKTRVRESSALLKDRLPSENKDPEAVAMMAGSQRIGFYMNFEGVDSAGHFFNGKGKTYRRIVSYAIEEIEKIEKMVEDYYKDNLTTYIVTADHGMSLQGAHGGDSKYELSTPLLMWGNGISESSELKPNEERKGTFYDFEDFNSWIFPKNRKHIDIQQNSLPALISAIMGVGFPQHNIGVLDENILPENEHFRTASLLANFKQLYVLFENLLSKYNSQCLIGKKSIPRILKKENIDNQNQEIINLMRKGDFSLAKGKINDLINIVNNGLYLISNFGKLQSKILIFLSYIIFILFSVLFSLYLKERENSNKKQNGNIKNHFIDDINEKNDSLLINNENVLNVGDTKSLNYGLENEPTNLRKGKMSNEQSGLQQDWKGLDISRSNQLDIQNNNLPISENKTYNNFHTGYNLGNNSHYNGDLTFSNNVKRLRTHLMENYFNSKILNIFVVIYLSFLAISIFFFPKWKSMLAREQNKKADAEIEIETPLKIIEKQQFNENDNNNNNNSNNNNNNNNNNNLGMRFKILFAILSIIASSFILKDPGFEFQPKKIMQGGIFLLVIPLFLFVDKIGILNPYQTKKLRRTINKKIFFYQLVIIVLSTLISYDSSEKFMNQDIITKNTIRNSWILIGLSILPLFFPYSSSLCRLITVFYAFSPFFILVTLNQEVLFFGVLFLIIISLKRIIKQFRNYKNVEWITASLTLYLFILAYFGTGNLISISSFCYKCANKILSIEDYLIMMILIMVKIFVPIIFCNIFLQIILKSNSNYLILIIWNAIINLGSLILFFMKDNSFGTWDSNYQIIIPFIVLNVIGVSGVLLSPLSKLFLIHKRKK